jgi:hypothetical protein
MALAFPCILSLQLSHTILSPTDISAFKQLRFLHLTSIKVEDSQVSAVAQALASLPNLGSFSYLVDEDNAPLSIANELTGLTQLVIDRGDDVPVDATGE